MADKLDRGCLKKLIIDGTSLESFTVQITGWRSVARRPDGDQKERTRLQLSDGEHRALAVVGVERVTDLLQDGLISENGVIRITKFCINSPKPKPDGDPAKAMRILVVQDGEVILPSADGMFGNPVDIKLEPKENLAPVKMETDVKPVVRPEASNGGIMRGAIRPTPEETQEAKKPRVEANRPAPRPAAARAHNPPGIFDIASLNPYQTKWKIRARVTQKNDMKQWSNARGEGCLFSMDLTDASGDIRATAFKDEATKFFDILVQDKVYDISGGQIKPANKKFSSLKHEYEITFSKATEVDMVADSAGDAIPSTCYNFETLEQLLNHQKDDVVDVIAVIKSVGNIVNITSKAGKELVKRDIVICDDTNKAINLTFWASQAEKFPEDSAGHVIALKTVRINDFNGINLSTGFSSRYELNPNHDRAIALSGWWVELKEAGQTDSALVSLSGGGKGNRDSTPVPIGLPEAWNYGSDPEVKEYFSVRAIIHNIKAAECLYKACPAEKCNKRVIESGDLYRCEKCGKDTDGFKWAAMIQMQIMDSTGAKWLTLFGDYCLALTGKTPGELGDLREQKGSEEFESVFNDLLFCPFIFRISARPETYNDQTTIKWRCYGVRAPTDEDEAAYVAQILSGIDAMKVLTD